MAAHLQPGVYMETCHWLGAFRTHGRCMRLQGLRWQARLQLPALSGNPANDAVTNDMQLTIRQHASSVSRAEYTQEMWPTSAFLSHRRPHSLVCKSGSPTRELMLCLARQYVNDIAIQITQERRMLIRCSWSSLVSQVALSHT